VLDNILTLPLPYPIDLTAICIAWKEENKERLKHGIET
jgi:hypothetical protein